MFESPAFDTADLPALHRLQNFVHYHRTLKSGNTGNPEDVVALVNELRYTNNMDDNRRSRLAMCTRIWITDSMERLRWRSVSDWYLNRVSPVEPAAHCRAFHVIGFFIIPQLTQARQTAALDSLMRKCQDVSGLAPAVKYCVGDADHAQRNAFATVSRELATAEKHKYWMYYYHVLANIEKRTTKWPEIAKALVYYHTNLMHFCASKDEFKRRVQRAYGAWSEDPALPDFADYFERVWVASESKRWQCFRTPGGYAKTNNPTETFNNIFKREYTLRTRMKLAPIIKFLRDCCQYKSLSSEPFRVVSDPATTLKTTTRHQVETKLLEIREGYKDSLNFILDDGRRDEEVEDRVVRVKQVGILQPGKRGNDQHSNSTMEQWDQPSEGWPVNLDARTCACRNFYKNNFCNHLIFALDYDSQAGRNDLIMHRGFVNRSRKSHNSRGGRPPINSSALNRR